MKNLTEDWFASGVVDFEYKKYVLLAYLQHIQGAFKKNRLYPFLSDVVFHYNNILSFKKNQNLLTEGFGKSLTGVDLANLKLVYERVMENDEMMKEIEDIVAYAAPLLRESLEEGKEIYDFVEDQCEVMPIGLLPLYTDEGYLFVGCGERRVFNIYRYQLALVHHNNTRYRAIHTSFIKSVYRGLGQTYESIKVNLVNTFRDLPNPATFLIRAKMPFPYAPTIEPIAKRMVVGYLAGV